MLPSIGSESDKLLVKYIEFLIECNLIYFDFSLINMDLEGEQIYPTFIAKLTDRGIRLNRYIKKIHGDIVGYPLGVIIDFCNPYFQAKLEAITNAMDV